MMLSFLPHFGTLAAVTCLLDLRNAVHRVKQKHNLLFQIFEGIVFSQRVIKPKVEIMPIPVGTYLKSMGSLVSVPLTYLLAIVLENLIHSLVTLLLWHSGKCFTQEKRMSLVYPSLHSLFTSVFLQFIYQIGNKPQPLHSRLLLSQQLGFSGGHLHNPFRFFFRILTEISKIAFSIDRFLMV